MKKTTFLTNERLKYKFKNFFDLVNEGILIAKQIIAKEKSITLKEVMDDLVKLPDTMKEKKD